MRNVDGAAPFLAYHIADRLEDFDLRGHIQSRGGLVQNQELRVTCHGHRDHDPLALSTADLIGISLSDLIRIRKMHQIHKLNHAVMARIRLLYAMHEQAFDDLTTNRDSRIERRRGALRDIGHLPAADVAKLFGASGKQVGTVEIDVAPDRSSPGPVIAQR